MNAVLLERLLAMAKKTGDRLVVVEGDSAVVLLPIERYEELLGGVSHTAVQPTMQQAPRVTPHAVTPVAAAVEPTYPVFRSDVRPVPQEARDFPSSPTDAAVEEEQFYLEPVE